MGTVQLSPPAAPFQRIKNPGESITINTAGKVLVLPTADLNLLPSFNQKTLDSNRLTIAESPFGGLKGAGSPDYAVGTLHVNSGDGIYLTDKNGNNSTKTLTAGKLKEVSSLTINTTAKTITEEIIISNTNTATSSEYIIQNCDSVPAQWAIAAGTGNITSENGRIKVVGTADASTGYLLVVYTTPMNLSAYNFVGVSIEANINCSARFRINASPAYKTWESVSRFALTANTNTRFIYPIDTPQGTTGVYPSTVSGTFAKGSVGAFSVGVLATPGAAVTFYLDNITADVGTSAFIELQTPDNLADTSLQIQAWDGSAYQVCGNYKLDSSYAYVSGTAANWKLNDATKLDDVYGSGLGRALFPKSTAGQTVNGSTGTMTYSGNKGTSRRIGLKIDLPPSDNGRTNFNKIRLKTILTYANSGATSYDFDDSTNASYGLQNMSRPFIALYDPAGNYIDFFLFTHRPKNLIRKRDDSGNIYEVTLYPGNGSIYRGRIKNADLTTDTDSNLIPNCLESTIEGSVTKFLSRYSFFDDLGQIAIVTTGSTFAPILTVDSGATIAWVFGDGQTSTSATPSITFSGAATRTHTLKVTPWGALTGINVGYSGADEGDIEIPLVANQNVTKIGGLQSAPNLKTFCASTNPVSYIDFSNLLNLETIECYSCTSLIDIELKNLPKLKRLCLENCRIPELDLFEVPLLEDLRGALNANPFHITWSEDPYEHLWHICIRSNTFTSLPGYPALTQFPVLEELLTYSTNQTGTLTLTGSTLQQARVQYNSWSDIIIEDSCTALKDLYLTDCGLSQTLVDYVLHRLDTLGKTNGQLLIAGTNSAPSAEGLVHWSNLQAKGWLGQVTV